MKKISALISSLLAAGCCCIPAFADLNESEANLVASEDIIVSYKSSVESLPNLDVIVWLIFGILVAGCAVLALYKIIQWRNSK